MRFIVLMSVLTVLLSACGTAKQSSTPVSSRGLIGMKVFTAENRRFGDTERIAREFASVAQRCLLGKTPSFDGVRFNGIATGAVPTSRVLNFVSTPPDLSRNFRIYIARSQGDAPLVVMINLIHEGPEVADRKVLLSVAADEILNGRPVPCKGQ